MHFSMNYAKEHYFLGYFAKLIFTQQFLQSSQNTVYSLHECLSLFRKKMYLTLNGKLRKVENKFTFYYENSLRVMNLISQGLLREAQLVLDYENPYYFAFFEYVERERDKIEKGLKKNKPMNKKKRKYHWNVEIDCYEQKFRLKNMDKGYEYQLRQGKLNLGIKGLQFYGKGFSSSSQILSNLVSRIFKQEQYT